MSDIPTPVKLRLGARGSLLSRMQSQGIADELQRRWPGLTVELVIISTSGDRIQDQPLHAFGGKGLFTKELELALLSGEVDFAVHSFKDVPVTMPLVDQADLIIAAVPERADPRDLLVSKIARRIADLPQAARVGTGSLRRQCQLLALRPDLKITMIRGNVDTRVRKLNDGEFDAVILASAGLHRAGLFDSAFMTPIEPEEMLPAAGQGALALQCRKNDLRVREILRALNHPPTATAVEMERAVVQALQGDCHSPIGAWARLTSQGLQLHVAVGKKGGGLPVMKAHGSNVSTVLQALNAQGAQSHLHA